MVVEVNGMIGQSTAGKTTSTTISVFLPKARTSNHADRYSHIRTGEKRWIRWLTWTQQFYLAYRSLCPNSWVMRWNDQREAGNFPVDLEH